MAKLQDTPLGTSQQWPSLRHLGRRGPSQISFSRQEPSRAVAHSEIDHLTAHIRPSHTVVIHWGPLPSQMRLRGPHSSFMASVECQEIAGILSPILKLYAALKAACLPKTPEANGLLGGVGETPFCARSPPLSHTLAVKIAPRVSS